MILVYILFLYIPNDHSATITPAQTNNVDFVGGETDGFNSYFVQLMSKQLSSSGPVPNDNVRSKSHMVNLARDNFFS